MAQRLRVVIVGAPSSGKTTQALRIHRRFGLVHLGIGDILRVEMEKNSALGQQVKPYVERGAFVPDAFVHEMVCNRLRGQQCIRRGWVLDGFPKNPKQAFFLITEGFQPTVVISLKLDNASTIIQRTVGRRLDSETGDIYHIRWAPPPENIPSHRIVPRQWDTTAAAKLRIEYFKKFGEHVKRRFPGLVHEVDASKSPDEVFQAIEQILNDVLHPLRAAERKRREAAEAAAKAAAKSSTPSGGSLRKKPQWNLQAALSPKPAATTTTTDRPPPGQVPIPRRRRKKQQQQQKKQQHQQGAADLDGLRHLRETMEEDAWKALVASSRAKNALTELTDRTAPVPGDIHEGEEEGEVGGQEREGAEGEGEGVGVSVSDVAAALFTPSRQWIPDTLFGEDCMICWDQEVQGDGIFCPSCKTPICNECSVNMTLEIIESMQSDLGEYPPKCKCCRSELVLPNFENVLYHLMGEVTAKGIKKEVLVKQYELIMIASAFEKSEMTEVQISCPFCKCITLYEDCDSVVIVHCQAEGCGRCFCWRCNLEVSLEAWARYCQQGAKAEQIDEIVTHYTKCRSLNHVRKEIEEAVEWGSMNRCPTCHVPGQKDHACTHISCNGGCPRWCYVCEKVLGGSHNSDWQTNPERCPSSFSSVPAFDSTWPRGAGEAVEYYHKQKTLRALREVVDRHGILAIALLKKDIGGIFGGFSLGQVMKVGANEPFFIQRGQGFSAPRTPTTATLLANMEKGAVAAGGAAGAAGSLPPVVPPTPKRRVRSRRRNRRRRGKKGRGRGRRKAQWNPFDAALEDEDDEKPSVPPMPSGDVLEIFTAGTLVYSLFTFEAHGGEELSAFEGDVLRVAALSGDHNWVFVYHLSSSKSGYIPTSYLRPIADLAEHQRTFVPRNESAPNRADVPPTVRKSRGIVHASAAAVRRALKPPTPPSPDSYPCVAGWCLVEMAATGEKKQMRDLRKGDVVKTANGSSATVICMLKTVVPEGVAQLVRLTEKLAITAHHPVRIDGIWQQPDKLGPVETLPCEDLYLFLLSNGHSLFVDGIECVGLAHGFTDNEVVSHGYFGTQAVVEDLRKMPGWEGGCVVIRATGRSVKRDPVTNGVVGIVGRV